MRLRTTLACLALAPAAAAAQTAPPLPVELGVDAAITTDDATDATRITVPLQRLRVGVFFSPRLSLEPTLTLDRRSGDGVSLTNLDAAVGLLAHVGGTPTGRLRTPSLFVRPFAGVRRASFSFDGGDFGGDGASESATQGNLGLGVGVKLPMADRLATRLEAAYTRAFETDEFPAANVFTFTVGISFHTR